MTSIARAMLEGRFNWEKDQQQVTRTTPTTKKRKSSVKSSAAK